ncbi:MAG: hypothetical protein GY716_01490 [bacterium]|nr:hypothetical protein [bacterium]
MTYLRRLLSTLLVLAVVASLGCSDYKLSAIEDAPEEEPDYDPELDYPTECFSLTLARDVNPGLGWPDETICSVDLVDVLDLRPGSAIVYAIDVNGVISSQFPGGYLVRVVAAARDEFGNGAYPSELNHASGDALATGATGMWLAEPDPGSINNCSPDCDWWDVIVEIQDPLRPEADLCDDYVPEVEVCFAWAYTSAERDTTADSACVPGSGRFQLLPWNVINNDGDSSRSVILKPIQVGGTGAMTGSAWIEDIDVIEAQGQTLRVIRSGETFRFAANDVLVDPLQVSHPASAPLPPNTVGGGAPFVLSEIPETTNSLFLADMTWNCAAPQPEDVVMPTPGYLLGLSEPACAAAWPQKLILRPRPFANPVTLDVEPYGQPRDRVRLALTESPDGKSFRFSRGDLVIEGVLVSHNLSGATIRLDKVDFLGQPLCTPDVFDLVLQPCAVAPAERIRLFFPQKNVLRWSRAGCAQTFNVYSATVERLVDEDADGLADDYGSCLHSQLTTNEIGVPVAPSPGLVRTFLVTGKSPVGEGSLGFSGTSLERPNVSPCP